MTWRVGPEQLQEWGRWQVDVWEENLGTSSVLDIVSLRCLSDIQVEMSCRWLITSPEMSVKCLSAPNPPFRACSVIMELKPCKHFYSALWRDIKFSQQSALPGHCKKKGFLFLTLVNGELFLAVTCTVHGTYRAWLLQWVTAKASSWQVQQQTPRHGWLPSVPFCAALPRVSKYITKQPTACPAPKRAIS